MAYLTPYVVARAARALFKASDSTFFIFLCMKAAGISTVAPITIQSTEPTGNGIELIAQQPPGFDDLVIRNLDRFSTDSSRGLPTRPEGRERVGSTYSLYVPVNDNARYLLRKSDVWRAVIWTQMEGLASGSVNNGNNLTHGDKSKIYAVVKHGEGRGSSLAISLVPGYEQIAMWNFGPEGVPVQLSLRALAIWVHRMADLPGTTTIESLVEATVQKLHLTPLERDVMFYEDLAITISPADFGPQSSIEDYFETLCLPSTSALEPLSVAPTPASSPKLVRLMNLDAKQFDYRARMLDLRTTMPHDWVPENATKALLQDGYRNILLYGPPRTGKTHAAFQIAADYLGVVSGTLRNDERFKQVQFHHAWGYGDFIRKISPTTVNGTVAFKLQNGVFLEHCLKHPSGKSVFLIEELTRAELAQVLGEAFQVFEEGYRGIKVSLPASLVGEGRDRIEHLIVPPEMLIIATANSVDRSTTGLDIALLERFASVEMPYRPNEVYKTLLSKGWREDQAETFVSMIGEAAKATGFPVGHALFYSIGVPGAAWRFYHAKIRAVLDFYLTEYEREKLVAVDHLFSDWYSKWVRA
ncbi:AAA family ATPase [Pyxidicoccus sp. MSG2]|uniref:AAA family ATPase n=1 Tax=Pyxidicoccus sp. MSG2 TaxID=2996790 RepID=UPI00226F75F0|nr:AAA family ATPase [Pyxidicoccus sp. MSG2]MCY1020416.1 AAA family ATPase [Pyxidicoccus sp. MSG2]